MDIKNNTKPIREFAEKLIEIMDELESKVEPDIEVGQYWEVKGSVYRTMKPRGNDWQCKNISTGYCIYPNTYFIERNGRLLSDSEVEKALIKEAERRGFKVGSNIIDANIGDNVELTQWNPDYLAGQDWLLCDGQALYEKGDWAEIITDEWEVVNRTKTHSFVHAENLVIDMSGKRSMTQKEAETIRDALNDLEQS